jgi:Flp pilus assembly protein TadD
VYWATWPGAWHRNATRFAQYHARQARAKAGLLPSGPSQRSQAADAEQRFLDLLSRDPSDTRTYVSLGTLYVRQRRFEEARRVYEAGCAVAEGGNAYLWTSMGNLERKARPRIVSAWPA